jgi:hypothetical protein
VLAVQSTVDGRKGGVGSASKEDFPVEWLAFNHVAGVKIHHLVRGDYDAFFHRTLLDHVIPNIPQ